MHTRGKIEKIDKHSNLVVNTPSAAAESTLSRYSYYLVVGGRRFYYADGRLTKNVRVGDDLFIVFNDKDEILAWKNLTNGVQSRYSSLHLIFHSNTIVAVGTFLVFFFTLNTPDYRSKLLMFGLPVVVGVMVFSVVSGRKKLHAQRQLPS